MECPIFCETKRLRVRSIPDGREGTGCADAAVSFPNVSLSSERPDGSDAGDSMPPAGQFAGRVADYYDSEANPLFELEIGGRRVLVPAAEEFIAHIDFEGRTMKLVLPEGLLDL